MKHIWFALIFASIFAVIIHLLVIISDAKFDNLKIKTVDQFYNAAVTNQIIGKTESSIIAVFGKPKRIRLGNGYFVYVYRFQTNSILWDTECVIRFDDANKRVVSWQLNSD